MAFLYKVKLWIQASRALYTITALLPCCIGALVAWHEGHSFDWGLFVLILIGMMFANIGTNFTNDYYDYKSGVDKLDEGRIYKKGAEVLYHRQASAGETAGSSSLYFFSPQTVLISALSSFLLTALIGIYFVLAIDWRILPIGIAGLLLGYFYTAPPVKLGYRGFGELMCFLGSGPLPVIGTYFLFSRTVSNAAILSSAIVGLLVAAIVYIGNVPDADADKQVGKKTLSVILGKRAVTILGPLFYGMIFLLIILGVLLKEFPAWALLSFITLPLIIKILVTANRYYSNIPRFAPTILLTVKAFSLCTALFGIGLIIGRIA
jgi:1,4-dihydroxy-2-naphthoate octaprenyltransferase